MIKVTVKNNITITGLTEEIKTALIDKFAITNQAYGMALKRGYSVVGIPKKIHYVTKNSQGDVVLPRGLATYVVKMLKQIENKAWEWKDETTNLPAWFDGKIELREYQKPIVENVLKKFDDTVSRETSGILKMGTGTGKTIVALEIARRLGITTTVIVPNNVLLNQWLEEINKWFPDLEPGVVNGKERVITPLTIATWQTLAGKTDVLAKLNAKTSLLIIEEANGVTSPVRRKILGQFNPTYIIGLTATPERTDGQGRGVEYLLGLPLAIHEQTQLKPTVETIRTGVAIPFHRDYHIMVDAMVKDDNRNTLISGLALGEMLSKRKVLVLTKRVEHYQALMANLPKFKGIYAIDSTDPNRQELLNDFKDGKKDYNAILGTVSLLAVGTDIPSLDTIIIACDIKSSVLTTQLIGRILRVFEGKQTPRIIDLHDDNSPVFSTQYWSRWRLYIAKGWVKKK